VILAAALDGMERETTPGPPVSGDGYRVDDGARDLPLHMHEALRRCRESSFISSALGPELQRNLSLTKAQELAEFERRITSLEHYA
jgi:glutamine synthetase